MRKLLLSPPRLCRECFLRSFRQISTVSDASTTSKPVPLRIFATEVDSDGESRSLVRKAPFTPTNPPAGSRHHAASDTNPVQAPPAERLRNDLKSRVGRPRPRSVFAPTTSTTGAKGPRIRMSSRMPVKSTRVSFNAATPDDLLQPPEGLEKDTLLSAIDGCLSAAMERLELSPSNPQPRSPEKTAIPHDQYMWLCSILHFQFTKSQLIEYGQKYKLSKARLTREKTETVIRMILDDIWKLEKEPELPPDEALITKSMFSPKFTCQQSRYPYYAQRTFLHDRRR